MESSPGEIYEVGKRAILENCSLSQDYISSIFIEFNEASQISKLNIVYRPNYIFKMDSIEAHGPFDKRKIRKIKCVWTPGTWKKFILNLENSGRLNAFELLFAFETDAKAKIMGSQYEGNKAVCNALVSHIEGIRTDEGEINDLPIGINISPKGRIIRLSIPEDEEFLKVSYEKLPERDTSYTVDENGDLVKVYRMAEDGIFTEKPLYVTQYDLLPNYVWLYRPAVYDMNGERDFYPTPEFEEDCDGAILKHYSEENTTAYYIRNSFSHSCEVRGYGELAFDLSLKEDFIKKLSKQERESRRPEAYLYYVRDDGLF